VHDAAAVQRCCNVLELEPLARAALAHEAYEYYAGGANDEITLRENRRALDEIAIRYRVLVDVATRSLETTVLGTPVAMPILIAPTAFQRMAHADGEVATARAAAAAGTLMVMSTAATSTFEDVAATGAPLWFQLYVYKDRAVTKDLVEQAEALGFRALALTVDTPILGRRERDVRNEFRLPDGIRIANGPRAARDQMQRSAGESALFTHWVHMHDASVSWRDVEWLQSITRMPIVLKGVVRGDDAERAVEHGVRGIIVSNHGGRQLDGSIATARALPDVVAGAAGRAEVYLDGGVRRGVDAIRAIALGARAVLIGRPVIWGLAAAGEAGVSRVLSLLRDELDLAMALAGCATVADITPDLLAPVRPR
jgi:4-hydroxymandelate oxidase